jgi:mannose-1-phosphate guanylyltransferase
VSRPRLRALVLAAGHGTRLRPLTDNLPKPLLPVAGRPVLDYTLDALLAVGCQAAAVNLHHLGDRIRAHYGDDYRGMRLEWSVEEGERKGTLGALHPLKGFLGEADAVILLNGDTLCPWPLKRMLRHHRAKNADVTLLLTGRVDPAGFAGGVGIDRDGRVLSFWQGATERGEVARRAVFAGAHVLDPKLLAGIAPGPADIVRTLYLPMLERPGRIHAVHSRRRWHDLGTPRRYLDGVLDWGRGTWPRRFWRRTWVADEARVEPGAHVRRSVVEPGATVAAGARLDGAVVLAGARVPGGARVRDSIVGLGVELPAEASIDSRLITAARDGLTIDEADSQVGGLIYTPLDVARRRENPGL